jgi:hypothetical protein
VKKSQKKSLKVYRRQLRKAAKNGDAKAQDKLNHFPNLR